MDRISGLAMNQNINSNDGIDTKSDSDEKKIRNARIDAFFNEVIIRPNLYHDEYQENKKLMLNRNIHSEEKFDRDNEYIELKNINTITDEKNSEDITNRLALNNNDNFSFASSDLLLFAQDASQSNDVALLTNVDSSNVVELDGNRVELKLTESSSFSL